MANVTQGRENVFEEKQVGMSLDKGPPSPWYMHAYLDEEDSNHLPRLLHTCPTALGRIWLVDQMPLHIYQTVGTFF